MEQNSYVVRFIVAAGICLFIGTLQGVVQVIPPVKEWIHHTGEAGHMVDPLAHAHINLIGGVVLAVIAFIYYALPRLLKRPLYSSRLTALSFYLMLIGVFGWYGVLIVCGVREGNLMLDAGISFEQAKAMSQPYHTVGILMSATIMALGHWAFVANTIMTVVRGKVPVGALKVVEEEAGV